MEEKKTQSQAQSQPQLSEEELTGDSAKELPPEPQSCCNPDCEEIDNEPDRRFKASTPQPDDNENCSNGDE